MNDSSDRHSDTEQRSRIDDEVRWSIPNTLPSGKFAHTVIVLVTFAVLLGLWQAYVTVAEIPTVILPSPLDIGIILFEMYPVLVQDAGVTAVTAVLGLALGTFVGLGLGMGMVISRPLARTVLPYIVAMRIAPLVAIAPLLFLWFGRGIPARALLVTTLTVFPITIATVDGLRSTPVRYLDLLRSVDASRRMIFFRVRIPAAAPSVFAGFKIAATLSVIGAVVAEFVTLQSGIGYRVFETAAFLRTSESFAALVVLAILGNVFYLVPAVLERRLWNEEA